MQPKATDARCSTAAAAGRGVALEAVPQTEPLQAPGLAPAVRTGGALVAGAAGARLAAALARWSVEPMKVFIETDSFDRGSNLSTQLNEDCLGEHSSQGSASPRDDGAPWRSSAEEPGTPPPGLAPPGLTAEAPGCGLPSKGAEFHSTGECKPCAWFWKAQGCRNGLECKHCHLCPKGEIQRRKREKVAELKAEALLQAGSSDSVLAAPAGESTGPTTEQFPKLRSPVSVTLVPEPALCLTGPCAAEVGDELSTAVPTTVPSLDSLMPLPETPAEPRLPSRGSFLHGTGECRPCAWFWKPQGCSNGLECNHCHACPPGEIKARRQAKLAAFRNAAQGDAVADIENSELTQTEAQQEQQEEQPKQQLQQQPQLQPQPQQQQQEAVPHGNVAVAPGFLGVDILRAKLGMAAPPPAGQVACPAGLPPGLEPDCRAAAATELLASRGAAAHFTGQCQPCAWFWKPQGCSNGQECSRCHLCPEGEVKRRRKAKIVAMKMAQRPGLELLEETALLPRALLE